MPSFTNYSKPKLLITRFLINKKTKSLSIQKSEVILKSWNEHKKVITKTTKIQKYKKKNKKKDKPFPNLEGVSVFHYTV